MVWKCYEVAANIFDHTKMMGYAVILRYYYQLLSLFSVECEMVGSQ